MDRFTVFKKNVLAKKDKSNKGSIDEPIRPLIEKINSKRSYCTTSSCSGRIVLWVEPKSRKKNEVALLFVTHERATYAEIKKSLTHLPKNKVWFRFEPMILHVACKTIEDASILLDKACPFFKHSGIITTKRNMVVEIRGSEFIEALVAKEKETLVSDDYLKVMIAESNKKMKNNLKKIERLTILLESHPFRGDAFSS